MSKKNAAIFFPFSYLDTNPTMRAIVDELMKGWDRVDIFCSNGLVESFVKTKSGNYIEKEARKTILNPTFFVRSLLRRFVWIIRLVWFFKLDYSVVMGANPDGLLLAAKINKYLKRPLVYLSFEIMFHDEVEGGLLEQKITEVEVCKSVSLVLVQDQERLGVLANENKIDESKIVCVPNAPLPVQFSKNDYLRKSLDISTDKKIVLYSGMINGFSSRDFLSEMVSYWSPEFVLVLHTSVPLSKIMMRFMEDLNKCENIFISTKPLDRKEFIDMVSSADFGLAPYKPNPSWWESYKNMYHIGLSSGKLSYYAMCGLPIVASQLPSYQREFSEYKCGKVYSKISEIGDLLVSLNENYEFHSNESKRFYKDRLDPEARIKNFVERIELLVGN